LADGFVALPADEAICVAEAPTPRWFDPAERRELATTLEAVEEILVWEHRAAALRVSDCRANTIEMQL
jgi:hypothetical protein